MRNSKQKNINKTKENKSVDFQYKYFMITIFVGVIHYIFFESHYIGSDIRYSIFVFWIPVIVGLILSVKFNVLSIDWNTILPTIKAENNIFYKIVYLPFLFFILFMFSVIIFWIPSNIIWDAINKMESNNNKIEWYTLNVEDFHHSSGKGGSNRIRFIFNGEKESIKTRYQDIKPYLDKNPNNYQVNISLKKGIWNYYILHSWVINEVPNQ